MMKNALVLGGNGFIGSHLVDRLLAEGMRVRVYDKYPERYRLPLADVDYVYGDFGNRGGVSEALRDIDVVFHLICTTHPKTSNDDPVYDVQSNVIETIFLLEQCLSRKVKKVVYASSGGTIYGRASSQPIAEESPTEPECSYGICKLAIEKYLALFHQLHGLDYVIVRPSNAYGARQNPLGIQGAVSVFLGNLVQGKAIDIWGDGSISRDYIYVDDLVGGMLSAALRPARSRIFNLGCGHSISLNDLLRVIWQVTGCSVPVNFLPGRSFDVPELRLDIGRAGRELGWRPATELATGIASTYAFVRTLHL